MSYCVYKHTSPNGKVYIGITGMNPLYRWGRDGSNYPNNRHFTSAIQKYGWNNFTHEILYSGLDRAEACRLEIELIEQHKSNDPNYGYNQSKGGESANGYHHTDSAKERIGNAVRGRVVSDETRQKLRDSHLGMKRSAETKLKMSESRFKKVLCVETSVVYSSIKEAATAVGLSSGTHICLVCQNKRKTAGGYHWKYVEETNDEYDRRRIC